MCGITGFFRPGLHNFEDALPLLKSMGDILAHRGPDDHGEYASGSCGMAFRRLAIIDLVHGRQPMYSPRQKSVIVFNGEIYNYKELRQELSEKGVVFRTNSDTETIVAGYEVWGEGVVNKLRGIFSFAIHDLTKNLLFAARDHVGVKPFYYVLNKGCFVFASEIKSLLKFPGIKASVRTSMLPRYMSFLWVPAPDTLFENISMLEPGHMLQVSSAGGLIKKRYWNPDLISCDNAKSGKQWMELIDEELRHTVREQMISDVPLGAFLSGGVDSSVIIAYMNQVSDRPVTTYTTGFQPEDMARDVILSDLEHARIAARHLNVNYNELVLSTDVVDLLPKLVWHMDEPVADSAAITTYLICRAAKEQCTVMLSGVGGDEIFGGYPRYLANQLAAWYENVPRILRTSLLEWWIRRAPAGSNFFIRNAKKFIKNANMPFLDRYFGYLSYYSEDELRQLMIMDYKNDIFSEHRRVYEEYGQTSPIQSMMNLDLKTFLPNLNLLYTDKMSSAASVEVRVPFLDHLLVEKAAAIPDRFKVRHCTRKYLLKKIAQQYLPKNIVWRKKAGFGAPVGAWLKGQARGMMLDLLSEETIRRRGYFRYSFVKNMIEQHLNGSEYNANQLWQLIWLEVWHQTFIDRRAA